MIKLSVIVPVYNVEPYIRECVDSLLLNDIADMEVILVDDGSTDDSGKICEEYAESDKRVVVFHKENGGLSSARNYGLNYAQGTYIGFVDSDDIVDKNMYPKMIEWAQKTNSDIVICGIKSFTNNINNTYTNVHSEKLISFEGSDKYRFIVGPQSMGDFAFNKLYRREVIGEIRYPEGKIFEDIFTTYKMFQRANKIICIEDDLYYYRVRVGSISHSKKYNPRMVDIIEAAHQQCVTISERAPDCLVFAKQKYLDANFIALNHLYEKKRLKKEYTITKQIRRNVIEIIRDYDKPTRFEKESWFLRRGVYAWKIGKELSRMYHSLNRHPRIQRYFYKTFKKLIFN